MGGKCDTINSTKADNGKKREEEKTMEFTTIYKNGKPEHFFIKLDKPNEFSFIQPYFLVTSIEHKRHGRIKEMECLFSGSVFIGKQYHGYGYSCSADVYGELITIINKLHGKKLSERAKKRACKNQHPRRRANNQHRNT